MNGAAWNQAETSNTMAGHSIRLRYFIRGLAFCWTIVVGSLLCWQLSRQTDEVREVASLQARSLIQRDMVYREWVARNGGVYVPISAYTPSNPLLSRHPHRDIAASDGSKLTLVNPAYMSRLVYELAAERDGTRSHITSLKPFRAANAADSWETGALQAFEHGAKEAATVVSIDNRHYLRLMTPIITYNECLECHARQGYHAGDIRGGISVTVPLEPLLAISSREKSNSVIGFGLLWLLGMAGIVSSGSSLRSSLNRHEEAERRLLYMSTHDSLTGSYNRIYFETELARLARGRDFPIAVVMADLDRLKEVNDRLGHAEGDKLIRRAANVLKKACREADIIARLGGDEFALLLPGVDDRALQAVMLRIRKCIVEVNRRQGQEKLSLSLGAISADNPEMLQDALKQADLRMYQDKLAKKRSRGGGNTGAVSPRPDGEGRC